MKLGIATKIQSVTLIALLGLAAVVGLAAYGLHGAVTEARGLKTRDLVETAHGILAHFEAEERAGRMSREDAQRTALATVKALRYAGKEYFWINDMRPRMLMHPAKPELDGKDLGEMRDPNGKRLFREMVEVVKASGSGYVPYQWAKPGADQPVDKISFVKGFAPWGWLIGSGVYADDTAAQMRPTMLALLAGLLATAAVVGTIAFLVGRGVSRPALALAEVMGALAAGDLTKPVPSTRRADEIGRMMEATRVFKDSLVRARALEDEAVRAKVAAEAERKAALHGMAQDFEAAVGGIVSGVTASATQLRATSEGMAGTAAETASQATTVAAAAEQASSNVATVAAAAEELGASVEEIARQVTEAARAASAAAADADATAALVQALSKAVGRVGEVVQTIASIAWQTNLLALNATIEAARAGGAGKGFAVVATEVKALAGQTANATDQIAMQVGEIQAATAQAVSAIGGVAGRIRDLDVVTATIASAVEEQGAATREIVRNVAQAATGTGEVTANIAGVATASDMTGAAASQVLTSAADLSAQAGRLGDEMARFLASVRAA